MTVFLFLGKLSQDKLW